jgi:hypothetical protein
MLTTGGKLKLLNELEWNKIGQKHMLLKRTIRKKKRQD